MGPSVPGLILCVVCGVCAIVTARVLGAERAERKLISFDAGFDLKAATVSGEAMVRLQRSGEQTMLRLEATKLGACGITLAAPGGKWDLSQSNYISFRVRNGNDRAVRVDGKAANADAVGLENCAYDFVTIAPHQTGLVRVMLRRVKPAWVKVELPGIKGFPWGPSMSSQRPKERTVDASAVVRLSIEIAEALPGQVIEIGEISAGGTYREPTSLLADPETFFPFIDEYGQYRHADWPGKTHALGDLAVRRAEEEKDLTGNPGPGDWDQYGGWKSGPQLKATGHFYVTKHEGKWWFVDPEGRLFFSQGMNCVNHREGATGIDGREKWYVQLPAEDSLLGKFYGRSARGPTTQGGRTSPRTYNMLQENLLKKYGEDWGQVFGEMSHRRLRSWGINTIANWSDAGVYLQRRTAYTADVRPESPRLGTGTATGTPRDVFDPAFREGLKKAMEEQKKTTANDPWCIGYFVENEVQWGMDDAALGLATLAAPETQPAKRKLMAELKARYETVEKFNAAWGTTVASWEEAEKLTAPPDVAKAREDLVAFSKEFIETYFRTVREAIKETAPQKLYLGCRFAMARFSPMVLEAAARHCDVMTFNVYRRGVEGLWVPMSADVPMMIGEFHFGALDRGLFHTGLVPTEDQAERAASYKSYVEGALRDPRFVGCHWFKYVDQPLTGRPSDGECYQIGFLDIADTPYPEIIGAAREVGGSMYSNRMARR